MPQAGYQYLLAYKLTIPIYDYTVEFCQLCSPYHPNSPHFPNLPANPETTINLMITLISQALYLLHKLSRSLETKHTADGGFSEQLLRRRLAYRRTHSPTS